MAVNPLLVGNKDTSEYGDILFEEADAGWTLSFQPDLEAIDDDIIKHFRLVVPMDPIVLVKADVQAGILDTYPLNTRNVNSRLFQAKYNRIKLIRFEHRRLEARSLRDARAILSHLPSGFVSALGEGLGIHFQLRVITSALDKLNIDGLVIRGGRQDELPKIEKRCYVIAEVQFDKLRRTILSVHRKVLKQAREEKARVAHNELLTTVDPAGHPAQPPVYRPGGINAVIAQRSGADLSNADQNAVIAAARSAAKPAAKRKPEALLQLSREIELATLDELVKRFRELLENGVQERQWQTFLLENAFVLRLAFGYPVVQVQDQISVGGGKFNGTGTKISDFAVKAAATGNLALIEIKTSETPLLRQYRGDVYRPSADLTGAVSQVLDQVYHLQRQLPLLKDDSDTHDIHAFAPQGLVIAGRTPKERNQSKSFELFRHSLKSVMVITFEEMLAKLESLAEFLRSSDPPPPAESGTVSHAETGAVPAAMRTRASAKRA